MDPAYAGGVIGGGEVLAGSGPIPGTIAGTIAGSRLPDGTEVPLSDSGYNIQPGEWLAPAGNGGTANVAPAPANLPPALPPLQ